MEEILIIGFSLFVVGSIFFIGGTLAMGIMTGLISSIGVGFLLLKLKTHSPAVWKLMLKHQIITDLVFSCLFVILLNPATATGLIAGCSAAVFTSVGLVVAAKITCP